MLVSIFVNITTVWLKSIEALIQKDINSMVEMK